MKTILSKIHIYISIELAYQVHKNFTNAHCNSWLHTLARCTYKFVHKSTNAYITHINEISDIRWAHIHQVNSTCILEIKGRALFSFLYHCGLVGCHVFLLVCVDELSSGTFGKCTSFDLALASSLWVLPSFYI